MGRVGVVVDIITEWVAIVYDECVSYVYLVYVSSRIQNAVMYFLGVWGPGR